MARSPSRAGGQRTRLQLTGKGRNHPPRRCRLRTSKSSVRDHVSSVLPRMCGDRWQCSRNGRVSRRNEYRQQYKKRKENCVKQNSAHGVRSPGHDVSLLPAGASPVVMRGIYEVRRVVCDLVHIVRHFSLPDGHRPIRFEGNCVIAPRPAVGWRAGRGLSERRLKSAHDQLTNSAPMALGINGVRNESPP